MRQRQIDREVAAAVGERIRRWREHRGVSQRELARRTVPPTHSETVSRIESGTRQPTITHLYRIADALGVTPGRILDADPGETP